MVTPRTERVPLFLAPMAGVTDLPFRLLARECGADVTVTEFTAASGLSRADANSWRKLESDPREQPFVPQIFGGDKAEMIETVRQLSPDADVIDLNFGCPAPKVCRTSAGAAMLADPDRLVEMVEACIEVASCPVSVKLRLGAGNEQQTAEGIARRLETAGVLRIAVHGRTLRQGYSGESDWQAIGRIVRAVDVPVIANGDVVDAESARRCLAVTGAAGLMIGRGAIGDPAIFSSISTGLGWTHIEQPWSADLDRLSSGADDPARRAVVKRWAWRRYLELSAETLNGRRNKHLKRHAISFTKGLPGSRDIRVELHRVKSAERLTDIVDAHLTKVMHPVTVGSV